jgi:branched-chain amino acid transport system substrate-binding protein
MKRMNEIKAALLAPLLVGAFLLGDGTARADEDVKVGFALALSGFIAPYDDGPYKAAQLAIDDINAKGGLLGKKLIAVASDTKSDVDVGAIAATDVIGKGARVIMVTCDFDFGAPAAIVAQSQNVFAFSSCAADPKFGVQGIGPNAYTLATATLTQGSILAEFAYKQANLKTAYLLTDTSGEYMKSLCASFERRFIELAGEAGIVGKDNFHGLNDTSIAGQISRLKASPKQPDAVMFCGAGSAGASFIRQIRAAGIDLPLLAGESMDGAYWLGAVPDLSNFYVLAYGSAFGNDPDAKINDFTTRFTAKFGEQPATSHALTGYSVIEAWALAVERAGSFDTDAVRAELDKLKDEPFLAGKTSFSPEAHINLDRPMLVFKIVNGKHEPIGRFSSEVIPELKF